MEDTVGINFRSRETTVYVHIRPRPTRAAAITGSSLRAVTSNLKASPAPQRVPPRIRVSPFVQLPLSVAILLAVRHHQQAS